MKALFNLIGTQKNRNRDERVEENSQKNKLIYEEMKREKNPKTLCKDVSKLGSSLLFEIAWVAKVFFYIFSEFLVFFSVFTFCHGGEKFKKRFFCD